VARRSSVDTTLLGRLQAASKAFVVATDPLAARQALTWFQREKPELVSSLRSADDPAMVLHAVYEMMPILYAVADWRTIAEICEIGVVVAERLEAARPALDLLLKLGIARQQLNDDDRAIEIFTRVSETAGEAGDRVLRAQSLAHLGQVRRRVGDPGAAVEIHHEAAAAYVDAGDRPGEARTLGDLAIALTELGDTDGAIDYAERSRVIFQDLEDAEGEALALRFLAVEHRRAGHFDKAFESAQQAVARFESASAMAHAAEAEHLVAEICLDMGDLDLSLEWARRAVRRMPATARGSSEAEAFLRIVEALSALRELVQAGDDAARVEVLSRHPALLDETSAVIATTEDLTADAPDERARVNSAAAVAWLLTHPDGAAARWYAREWETVVRYAGGAVDHLPIGLADLVRRYIISRGSDRRSVLEQIIALLPAEGLAAVRGRYLLALGRHDMEDVSQGPDLTRIQANAGAAARLLAEAGIAEQAAEAYVLEGIAWRRDRSGDLKETSDRALRALRQALRLYRRSTHPVEWAKTLSNLGNVYWQYPTDQRRNLARSAARHAAALTVLTPDQHLQDWAKALAGLGLVLSDPSSTHDPENLEKGRTYLSRALEHLPSGADRAIVLFNLSRCYRMRRTGDYDANAHRALRHAREAHSLFEQFGTPENIAEAARAVADSLTMLRSSGDAMDEAVKWYRQGLASVPAERHPREHAALADNLASALVNAVRPTDEEIQEAIALHRTAVDLYGSCGDSWEQARARYNLARTLISTQRALDLDEVLELLERSLADRPVEIAPLEWAASATAVASTLLRRGYDQDRTRAVNLLREVTESGLLAGAPDQAVPAWSLLGGAYAQSGNWSAAAEALRHAVAAAELRYSATVLTASRASELARLGGLPRLAAYALARAGNASAAVAVLEAARARELGRLFDRDHMDLSAVDAQAPDAGRTYRQAIRRIAALEARQRQAPAPDSEETQQIHAALTDAYAMLRSTSETLRQVLGADSGLNRTPADIVKRAVEAGCPLAYLITTEYGSVALLAGAGSTDTVEALFGPLTDQELANALTSPDSQFSAELLDLLGGRFVGDLAQRLTELHCSRVALIPTGVLGILPVHAARYQRDGRAVNLLDEVDPSYALSARVLLAAHNVGLASEPERLLVAVDDTVPETAHLPWAREETAALERIFPGRTRRLTAAAATKTAVLAALPGATHVHLACHGNYDANQPMQSSLQLAADERLTLRELFDGRRLAGVQLVVASACESAVSDVVQAQDEALGLPAGLAYAGARTIVGTLWSIPDRSTELLISRFYVNHLLGDPDGSEGPMAPARALAKAQQWLRDAEPAGVQQFTRDLATTPATASFNHPAHWAAFVVYGPA
jgi:CHAT domain-containing protein/tetratricopeptide (TPR) repeat protein